MMLQEEIEFPANKMNLYFSFHDDQQQRRHDA